MEDLTKNNKYKEKSFGIVPFFQDKKELFFLVVKNKNGGHWAFPKGHKNQKELDIDAAKREFEEETGILNYEIFFEDTNFKEEYEFEKDGKKIKKEVIYFPAKVYDKKLNLQKEEISDAKWLKYEQAQKQLTFKEAKNVLKQANYEILKRLNFKIPISFMLKVIAFVFVPFFSVVLFLLWFFQDKE